MSTDQTVETQIGEYIAWLDGELGAIDIAIPERRRSRGRLLTLVAASALLVTAGIVALTAFRRDGGDAPDPGTEVPPASGWSTFPAPPLEPRWSSVSIGTGDGWFVWGGVAPDNTSVDGVEALFDGAYFDAATGDWRDLPEAPVPHESAQGWSAVWTGTEVVIVQGFERPKIAAFDVASFTWRAIAVTAEAEAEWARRESSYSTPHLQLIDGRIAMFGSGNPEEGDPATMLLLDPSTDAFTTTGPTPASMNSLLGPFAASNDEFFAVGGSRRNSDSTCPDDAMLYRFDVNTLSWSTTPLPEVIMSPRLAAWTGDRLIVGGGSTCDLPEMPRRDVWSFDPGPGTWERLDDLPVDHRYSQGDAVRVGGGVAFARPDASVLVFWSTDQTWSVLPSPIGPADMNLAAFGGRIAVWGAGISRPGPENGTAWCCRPEPAAFITVPAPPSVPPQAPPATVPAQYSVHVGDGAGTIAARLCVTLDELSAVNEDNDAYSGFVEGAELAVPEPSIAECTPDLEPPDVRVYVVSNGDTPATVAARWCVTIDELGAVNAGLDASTRFIATEAVAIPPASIEGCTPGAAPGTTNTPATPTTAAEPTTDYIVVEGDNPGRVAAKLCVSIEELNAANEGNPAYATFLIGDVLAAPPPSITGCQTHLWPFPAPFADQAGDLARFEQATADDPVLADGLVILPDLAAFGEGLGDVTGLVIAPQAGTGYVVQASGARTDTGSPWQLTLHVDRRDPDAPPIDPAFLGPSVELEHVTAYLGSDAGPQCPTSPQDGYNDVVYTWFDEGWTFSINATPLPGCEPESPFSVDDVGHIVEALLSCAGFDPTAGAMPACLPLFP